MDLVYKDCRFWHGGEYVYPEKDIRGLDKNEQVLVYPLYGDKPYRVARKWLSEANPRWNDCPFDQV